MAKKLGKRARKFAKKGLQTVEKTRRIKQKKPFFKKKLAASHHAGPEALESHSSDQTSNSESNHVSIDNNLENLFLNNHEEEELNDEFSDSDGYLSEDPECPYISESENETNSTDETSHAIFEEENTKISLEISNQKKNLENFLQKDPQFAKFLETKKSKSESDSEDSESSESESDESNKQPVRPVTRTTTELWYWLVTEDPQSPALINLLNTFYSIATNSSNTNPEISSNLLNFVLLQTDTILRARFGVTDQEGVISKLKNLGEEDRNLVKLYLKSCVGFLNQVTDASLICFILSRIRVSVDFLLAFPSMVKRLIKVLIHFWASGDESLSKTSFLLIIDLASKSSSNYFNTIMNSMYKTYISRSKFIEESNLKQIEFLMKSLLEIFALDPPKAYPVASSSLRQLAGFVKKAMGTKKEEDLNKIENFQFMNCLNLWVQFVCMNYKQKNDFPQLISVSIKIISGMAKLFPATRFVPLRVKCVKMLNDLSLSSGIFIPVSPLFFDCFEIRAKAEKFGGDETKVNLASLLKVPKYLFKSRKYQEECFKKGIELLCAHLSQWSYHVSFPELCTLPLALLKIILNNATTESSKRQFERLINQVESNRNFIQIQRDQVAFSPNDKLAVENFLLVDKSTAKTSFSQYYASMLQNSQI